MIKCKDRNLPQILIKVMLEPDLLNSILAFCNVNYRIDSMIIESGQRTVYRGHSVDMNTAAIIKISSHNENMIARIQREIGVLNSISSPYFPRFFFQTYCSNETFELFVDSFDPKTQKNLIEDLQKLAFQPFFLTCEEYIEHISWNDYTSRIRSEKDIAVLLNHLFEALDLLWQKKIVHRDIKPDNILIRANCRPVIIDLGIAKSLRPGTKQLTLHGLAPCTPQYAAPEQFEIGAEVTYKADQFAVGVIAYHMLTGEFPYGRIEDTEIEGLLHNFSIGMQRGITEINPNISSKLADLIHRLIEVQPYKRFRSAEAIYNALNQIGGN